MENSVIAPCFVGDCPSSSLISPCFVGDCRWQKSPKSGIRDGSSSDETNEIVNFETWKLNLNGANTMQQGKKMVPRKMDERKVEHWEHQMWQESLTRSLRGNTPSVIHNV